MTMDPQLYVGVALAFYTQNDRGTGIWMAHSKWLQILETVHLLGNMQNPVIPNQMVNGIFYASADTLVFLHKVLPILIHRQ